MSVERWARGSVGVNVALAVLHGLVAATSGSLGVGAELIHNVADLLAAAAVLLGVRLATRRSRAFPYGLYKVENLVAAGLAGMIFLTAYEIVRAALLGAYVLRDAGVEQRRTDATTVPEGLAACRGNP